MVQYSVPIEDYAFALDVLGFDEVTALPGFEDVSKDFALQIIEESGKFAVDVLMPLNRESDEVGVTFEAGEVRMPPGFVDAYRRFQEAGWPALTGPVEFGGQGLPAYIQYCTSEIMAATSMSFSQCIGLTHGAATAVEAHADEWLKQLYLPKMVSGEWSGTMCLTEPQAGTDLGLMRTKAAPADNGSYRISGTKIFISAGEHDMTSNIVHLVLARLPDAPPGVQGISLFLVPKFLPDDSGLAGERNQVECGSVEHKMGMRGSVAAVMNFDDAVGWLVGEPHKGLRAMFTMMNTARLLVSAQGPGAADAAYQSAAAYSRDRLQGRALSGAKAPDKAADPLIVHPDVRRMLLEMKVYAEGGRALGLWVMKQLDISNHHPSPEVRASAASFVALMTPLAKAWLSETGTQATDIGIQVFGGHGYIREWGMEQLLRDVRLVALYEGANGIQALDLVARKLPMEGGRMLRHLLDPIDAHIAELEGQEAGNEFLKPLEAARARLDQATQVMMANATSNPDALGAASMDYLKIAGYLVQAHLWALMGIAALARRSESPAFFDAKLAAARFFFARMLPFAEAHLEALKAGAEPVMALADEAF